MGTSLTKIDTNMLLGTVPKILRTKKTVNIDKTEKLFKSFSMSKSATIIHTKIYCVLRNHAV